jgi:hypothetical protein
MSLHLSRRQRNKNQNKKNKKGTAGRQAETKNTDALTIGI